MSGQVPSVHQQSVNAQQLQMYGENWADRFGRLLKGYGISQSRLAAVIGVSAPMISQLITGARVKISNPAVYGRIVRLEELVVSAAMGNADAAERGRILDEVTASHPALTTVAIPAESPFPLSGHQEPKKEAAPVDRAMTLRYLHGLADRAILQGAAAAAERLGGRALAELLTAAIDAGRTPDMHSAGHLDRGSQY